MWAVLGLKLYERERGGESEGGSRESTGGAKKRKK